MTYPEARRDESSGYTLHGVRYAEEDFSGWRPIWDIPAEDYLFGFALMTLTLMCWVRTGEGGRA